MKKLVIALVLVSSSAAADISSMCAQRWPGDYVMQEYCINEQRDAYRRINNRPTTDRQRMTFNVVDKGDCNIERQHVVDIAGAGLMGTQQYEDAKAAVSQCLDR